MGEQGDRRVGIEVRQAGILEGISVLATRLAFLIINLRDTSMRSFDKLGSLAVTCLGTYHLPVSTIDDGGKYLLLEAGYDFNQDLPCSLGAPFAMTIGECMNL